MRPLTLLFQYLLKIPVLFVGSGSFGTGDFLSALPQEGQNAGTSSSAFPQEGQNFGLSNTGKFYPISDQLIGHFVGIGYLAALPSPDDLPRIRRKIHGSAKTKNQATVTSFSITHGVFFAGGSGVRHAGSKGKPNFSRTASAHRLCPSAFK